MASHKLLQNRKALMNMVRRIAVEAGNLTLDYFENDLAMQADMKTDGSPVTLADKKAEAYITEKLKDLVPGILLVGEETYHKNDLSSLPEAEYFWLVDPLDGTKEFVSGSGEYTVNIALIHRGNPVIGVVYAPVKGELYCGYHEEDGEGDAIFWREDDNKEKPISVRRPPEKGLIVIASKNHGDQQQLEEFLQGFKVQKTMKKGSSLKICMIAAGKADLYPRHGPTCEWDTAAAHGVLLAAGGQVTDFEGKPLKYGLRYDGPDTKFLNPFFVAAGFDWVMEEN
ncbi:MAG: 3'(2'),5'-bisphosphate nucleotidase CysQ [Alphaproteobacteria bacterium]